MSRYHSYINSAKGILTLYKGEVPLSSFLKKYFSENKKFGSKDRKSISHLCYCYFRLGKAALSLTIEERILSGLLLVSNEPNDILYALKPEWNDSIKEPLAKKLLIISYSLLVTDVFPWKEELSDGIDHKKLCESFFIQPDVFLRVRPGKMEAVIKKLQSRLLTGAVPGFRIVGEVSIALPNAVKIENILDIDKEVLIQDLNSQRTGDYIPVIQGRSDRVWDCCAASGGKSIMAYDISPDIELTVSDIRESILVNLKKRFARAGIRKYKSFVADLTSGKSKIQNLKSQIIICDAPCTGSGTWSRTPEQLYFFDEKKIDEYATIQKKIVSNVIPQLQKDGSLIYITCSVFRKENEEVVDFIINNFHLQLKQLEVLKGYDKKADSMFVAVLSKS